MTEAVVEIVGVEMLVDYEYDITYRGCAAHMGSLSYEGHPAEAAEFEITVHGVRFPKQAADLPILDLPEWLKDLITTHLLERDDINDVVQKSAQDPDYGYDPDYDR